MSRWRLWSRRSPASDEWRAPEWVDAPAWVAKHARREEWGTREWLRWEDVRERFDRWNIELAPDAAGGRLAVHACSRDRGWVSGEFIEADDAKPLYAALRRLARQIGERVHEQAA
jgi:hypothetical protein